MQNNTSANKPTASVPPALRSTPKWMKSAQVKRCYRLGPYRAMLLGRMESASLTECLYVLAVYWDQSTEPCLVATSEVNAQCWNIGGGSHFLSVSYKDVVRNMGASDDWADVEKFTLKALTIAASELGVKENPREISVPSGDRDSARVPPGLATRGVPRT
jgi:hypothetical protein